MLCLGSAHQEFGDVIRRLDSLILHSRLCPIPLSHMSAQKCGAGLFTSRFPLRGCLVTEESSLGKVAESWEYHPTESIRESMHRK